MSLSEQSRRNGTHHTGIERRNDGWWVLGLDCGAMGPYTTKAEAKEDARGVERFYAREWKEVKRKLPALDDVDWEPGQRRLFE